MRGRTIFALPDRVLYGYFDTLARFIVESESWSDVPTLPLVAPSSDFVVMKLHLEAMAAAKRKDAATAKAKAAEMMERARVPGQHPFVQQILTMQAREAAAVAAHAAGDTAACGDGDGGRRGDRRCDRQPVAAAVSDHSRRTSSMDRC